MQFWRQSTGPRGLLLLACVWLAAVGSVLAQAPTPNPPAPGAPPADTLRTSLRLGPQGIARDTFGKDSLAVDSPGGLVTTDSLTIDSLGRDSTRPPRVYRLSPDAIAARVDYKMVDSMRYSIADKKIRLYREAEVKYTDITLTAGYMEIDYGTNVVYAEPRLDSAGQKAGLPSFSQGPQAFTAQGLRYNFSTRKGIITDAVTQQGDLYVLGGKTKIVAADERDPRRADNTVYNQDAIITTCELDHPHYGIRSSKQKVIPGKQVIVGPSNVELGGVPTPLWLPFGFFPIGSTERSGLIFPSDYTYTTESGFGFEGVGWYFPWSDNVHTAVTTDLFLKGTLRADVSTQYSRRYRYQGQFALNFSRNRAESPVDGTETFANSGRLVWNHTQDQKANPYFNFSANVNFQTNNNGRRNYASALNQVTNTASSTINASLRFPSHPSWNLSGGLQATQNFNTRRVNVRAPQLQFRTGQMFPFANAGNSRSWYRKFSIDYNAGVDGSVATTDTTIFDIATLRDAVLGGRQQLRVSAPINVLKYFRLSPNVSYQESYYLDERQQFFERYLRRDSSFVVLDGDTTFTFEDVPIDTLVDNLVAAGGIDAARSFSASVNLSTQIFGTARFRIGALRGIRHIVTPSISAGYQPDYSRRPFKYYRDLFDPNTGRTSSYLRFPNDPFSPGSLPNEQSFNISYSLGNRIESKVQTRGDSTTRILSLINSLNFNGSYNPGRDSLKWSNVNVSGAQASFFQKIIRVNLSSLSLGVYELNDALSPINETLASNGKFPFRVEDFTFGVAAGLNLDQARELIVGKDNPLPTNSIFGLVNKFSISYNYARNYSIRNRDGRWRTTANTVNVSGPLPITEKWSIRSITIGYDLEQRRITYPTLSLGRDLHCWEMDFFWSPAFGNQFTFSIRVKPSSLGFLSIPYRRGSAR